MPRVQSFAPVGNIAATVLVLGSMPGEASLAADEYYAHPRNHFWTIMGELVGACPELPYRARLKILQASGIALWDVLGSCVRRSSLDSRIEVDSEVPNDIHAFLLRHPGITRVFFNGAKAEQCFVKHVLPSLRTFPLQYQRLPSTSPANAGISYEKKLIAWQAVMRGLSEGNKNLELVPEASRDV